MGGDDWKQPFDCLGHNSEVMYETDRLIHELLLDCGAYDLPDIPLFHAFVQEPIDEIRLEVNAPKILSPVSPNGEA